MKSPHRKIYIQSATSLFLVLLITIIAGCFTVGPDYVRPDVAVSKDWNTQLKGNQKNKEMDKEALVKWWSELGDPKLSRLIEQAVKGNLDLKKAQARIREARARRGVAKASFFPTH
jgi:multidrug efflux system outer membrane protein